MVSVESSRKKKSLGLRHEFLIITAKGRFMKKLIVLAVVGVAVKLFLDSEQGVEIKRRIRNVIQDAQDSINGWLENVADKIEDTAADVDKAVASKMEY